MEHFIRQFNKPDATFKMGVATVLASYTTQSPRTLVEAFVLIKDVIGNHPGLKAVEGKFLALYRRAVRAEEPTNLKFAKGKKVFVKFQKAQTMKQILQAFDGDDENDEVYHMLRHHMAEQNEENKKTKPDNEGDDGLEANKIRCHFETIIDGLFQNVGLGDVDAQRDVSCLKSDARLSVLQTIGSNAIQAISFFSSSEILGSVAGVLRAVNNAPVPLSLTLVQPFLEEPGNQRQAHHQRPEIVIADGSDDLNIAPSRSFGPANPRGEAQPPEPQGQGETTIHP